jgi:hypothetical protein
MSQLGGTTLPPRRTFSRGVVPVTYSEMRRSRDPPGPPTFQQDFRKTQAPQPGPPTFQQDFRKTQAPQPGWASGLKQQMQTAFTEIMPVRNAIAHVREVEPDSLQRANLACGDVLGMLRSSSARPGG